MNCIGGARGAFRSNISNNYGGGSSYYEYISVPSSTTVTYEGIFNSTFFKLNSKEEKKCLNMEISLASVINPISNEKEVWLGTLLKSKYDGKKLDKLIDLSIAIDISGSMSGSRINMAKKSLINLIQKLNDEDNITISKFNEHSSPIFHYQKVSQLKKGDYISDIEKLIAIGGTDILKAFKGAYNLMVGKNINKNRIRRIIIITDMEDNVNEELTKFCEKLSLEGIYVTILGISSNFRTDLAEMTSHIKGANYVVIKESKDINKYLVEDFEYLCFQNASDISLEITSPYLKIERIVGSGKEGVEETYSKEIWNLEQHKFYSNDFKEKIFFLLLYFKRKNLVLPKPVILTLSEFMVPGVKKEISKIISSFPSQLKILDLNKVYVEGGMVLLRVNKDSIKGENIIKFEINYKNEVEDKKESLTIEYSFKKGIIDQPNYYSDIKIETALGLFYFAKFNRRFMKICNQENKKKKYDREYIKRKEFKDEKDSIKNFMFTHLNSEKTDYLNEELIKEYLDNMEKNSSRAIKLCCDKI